MFFFTTEGREVPEPNAIFREGTRPWNHVVMTFQKPWFLVVFRQQNADGADGFVRVTYLLEDISQIVDLQARPNGELEEVSVVVPTCAHGAMRWHMESVIEVWIGRPPTSQEGHLVLCYVHPLNRVTLFPQANAIVAGATDWERVFALNQ